MDSSATHEEASFMTPKPVRVRGSGSGSSGGWGTPIAIPASPFMEKLGCGTGVNVYLMNRCKLGASPWAVKKINNKCGTKQSASVYQKRLNKEAKVLKGINHPNIVGFRAFATANDGSKCLAMEYGGEQSLNELIEKRREDGLPPFPAATVEKVALHVARGLKYLHNERKLLHGDIKSCNVVIKGDFETVKICDVGTTLPLDENMKVSDPKAEYIGTEPWMPKEALEGGEITDKADVFSYGLTLWEMMTLDMPHLEMLNHNDDDEEEEEEEDEDEEAGFDEDAYYKKLGKRPALDTEALGTTYQKMVELFCLCTEEDPKMRPSAAQIVQALESNC